MRFALLLLLLSGCSRDDQPITFGGHTMGTTWSLKVDSGASLIRQNDLRQQLDDWEAIISHWRPDSAISRFNDSTSTDWISGFSVRE